MSLQILSLQVHLLNHYNCSYEAKVADFGLSRITHHSTTLTGMGTIAWCAPEVLLQETQGKPCDVWSFGVIMWELLCEEVPYGDMAPGAVVLGVVQKKLLLPSNRYLDGAPASLIRVVGRCQEFVAENRPSFKQIEDMLAEG
jgi:serine/threonine protein kinase